MEIKIGNVTIGNGIIAVQSMTSVAPKNIAESQNQINALYAAGCDIVRVAVNDFEDAAAIGELRGVTPIVADIHYDYRLALAAINAGADKIRINPGNLKEKFPLVLEAAAERGIPVRIGSNVGSVSDIMTDRVTAMVNDLEKYIDECERIGFKKIVLAAKSSNVIETIAANRIIKKFGYPIHLGVTEAGLLRNGLIKSSIGIGVLLFEGIGDTVRVSLSADPVEEVYAAKEILRATGLYSGGAEVVSCPTCGRCRIDLIKYASEIYEKTRGIKKPVKISVMGCAVNGIGEAKHSDIGLAGGDGEAVIFRKGEIVKKVREEDAVSTLLSELEKML